jgi:uncharacterized membrane protein YoaK (UPF0700 family)
VQSSSLTSPTPGSPSGTTSAGSAVEAQQHHKRALRLRQSLVVTLAVVSGATDAIGLLALGGAFTSVMTGNMVLLGVAASSADGTRAASSGFAILAFCAGAALGVRLAGTPQKGDRVWPRPVTVALAVELLFVAAYAIAWWATGGEPGSGLALAMLLSTAVALASRAARCSASVSAACRRPISPAP